MKTIAVIEPIGIIARTKGLIGYRKAIPMLFRTRFGIHTFGMKFPLDIIILNNKNQIVALKEKLLPWRIYLWNPKYQIVIELPEGTIGKMKLTIGEIISITNIYS
jgi:uncharacterized protein